jgi:hypothetical protein
MLLAFVFKAPFLSTGAEISAPWQLELFLLGKVSGEFEHVSGARGRQRLIHR